MSPRKLPRGARFAVGVIAAAFVTGGISVLDNASAGSGVPDGLTSPNGLYSIVAARNGVTLAGPSASITLAGGTITIKGATAIQLDGCAHPVARKGDPVNGAVVNVGPTTNGIPGKDSIKGTIVGGSPDVCAG